MSRFFSPRYRDLEAYVPGEQPKHTAYIKLNTNESPFAPPKSVAEAVKKESERLPLYPDPECTEIRELLAGLYDVKKENVFVANGSDDILNFAFMAFVNPEIGAAFADISYGFYKVFAELHHLPYKTIPLLSDFSMDKNALQMAKETLFIANPNAPTGLALTKDELEPIIAANKDRMVVIDEAYVDFGAESCLPLLQKYDNLLIVRTFSKSRSLAGGRLGYAFASPEIIAELNTIKYSTNPYNVNRLTLAAGCEIIRQEAAIKKNCREIIRIRENTACSLKEMGFFVTDSRANFIFVRHPDIEGCTLYEKLKEKNILVRHFSGKRISAYNRISIGSENDMQALCQAIRDIMKGNQA